MSSSAQAFSCFSPSFAEAFRQSPFVFSGTAVKTDPASGAIVLDVAEQWKGALPKQVRLFVSYPGGSVGEPIKIDLPLERKYLIYGSQEHPSDLITSGWQHCSRSTYFADAESDVLELRKYRQQLERLDKRIATEPQHPEPYLEKAVALVNAGDQPAATSVFNQVLAFAPDEPRALNGKADLLFGAKQYDAALLLYKKVLAVTPNNDHAKAYLNRILLETGRREQMDATAIEFTHAQLEKIDLSNANLAGRKIDRASFTESSFQNANLIGADLSGSSFNLGTFAGADLSHAKAAGAQFTQKVDFTGTSLANANFEGAQFRGTFDQVDFSGASLNGATFDDHSTLRQARFRNTSLQRAGFIEIVLEDADFTGAILAGSQFQSVKLERVHLRDAQLQGATFPGSSFDCATSWPDGVNPIKLGAFPFETECPNASFALDYSSQVFPDYSRFENAKLRGANFQHASLKGAQFWNADLRGADFRHAKLINVDFRNSDLENADFRNLSLSDINFDDTNLKGAKFAGASISNAQLSNANLSQAATRLAKYDCLGQLSELLPKGFVPAEHGMLPTNASDQALCIVPVLALDLREEKLQYADFRNVVRTALDLRNADLRKASFDGADMSAAKLEGAYLTGTRFDCQTKLPPSFNPAKAKMILIAMDSACPGDRPYPPLDLRDADLSATNLWSAQLEGADLRGANLSGTELGNARLSGAKFDGANLQGATYDHQTIWPEGFDFVAAGAVQGPGMFTGSID